MPVDRYYYSGQLDEGSSITLEGSEHHHLTHVLRGKPGDTIEVINGQGSLAEATIEAVSKRSATLIINREVKQPPDEQTITIIQAIPRMNRLDTIVEKGTELGMTNLLLWPSERSERKDLNEQQIQRLQQVAISAMKQCGRLYLPKIEFISKIEKKTCPVYFGDTNPEAPWFTPQFTDEIIFVIGPESGLTGTEEEILRNLGAVGVKLHKNILRTDTAPLVALTLIASNR